MISLYSRVAESELVLVVLCIFAFIIGAYYGFNFGYYNTLHKITKPKYKYILKISDNLCKSNNGTKQLYFYNDSFKVICKNGLESNTIKIMEIEK